jgi:hypothetical protein
MRGRSEPEGPTVQAQHLVENEQHFLVDVHGVIGRIAPAV